MAKVKQFVAEYRYRTPGVIGPQSSWKLIECTSMKAARAIAKGYEGRGDDMTWFNFIEPYNPEWHDERLKKGASHV